jgi:hypothetical protein
MNDSLREPGALDAPLSRQQVGLLETVATLSRSASAWPSVSAVDRASVRARKNLAVPEEIRAMPPGLIFASSHRPLLSADDRICMTVAGLSRCSGLASDLDRFLAAIRWCARAERRTDPEAGQTTVRVNRPQVARGVKLSVVRDRDDLAFLFLVLQAHRWGSVGSCVTPDGDWHFDLSADVRRFAKVDSIKDYLATYAGWMESLEESSFRLDVGTAAVSSVERESYVSSAVLSQLRSVAATPLFDLTKLIALAEELDGTYRAGYAYAPHAVLRGILDHIPPIFGQKGFAAVVNNHAWSTAADRKYMRRLEAFRDQADDALHRQVTRAADVLRSEDMPPAVWVNSLLRECCNQLTKP